ncbi:MAG: S46 family peptidase [Ignavibacteriales bacterium]|nr:S46 family peptidase [Ignavibacteriales bacterium]
MKNILSKNLGKVLLITSALFMYGCSGSTDFNKYSLYNGINLDTVKAGRFDTGKMWTFDNPPVEYFNQTYGFKPSEQWLEKVRKSALRFASYCSASFVSEDGLIMTNDHCGRASVTAVTKEGEDLQETSFFAEKLEDERLVKDLFVDQLVSIKDVTKEVQNAIAAGKTDEEKISNKSKIIEEITSKFKKESGLEASVVTLYNGGKYSLYAYKRYKDVRLVFAPETQLGFFGGDFDNFTYPRYNLDVTFFRVYDDSGKPLKSENYFKWSPKSAMDGEAIFVVGNPGRTNRLNTISQLEYFRDIQYPTILKMLNGIVEVYEQTIKDNPAKADKLMDRLYGYTNSQKVYIGEIKGLNDPYLMARKKDFEKTFRSAVEANPKLESEYGDAWENISNLRNEIRKYSKTITAYSLSPLLKSAYFDIAKNVITLANQLQKPENDRLPQYQAALLDSTIDSIFPKDFDKMYNDRLLKVHADIIIDNLGKDNELVQRLFGNKKGKEAADFILNKSKLVSKESLQEFLKNTPEQILNSDDPFIYFLLNTQDKLAECRAKVKELTNKEEVYNQKLGRAIFEVYGTSIPPDATFTLRIADGVVQGYDYNGTKAPAKTTFYGMYDRFYSFQEKYPWNLPERWKKPPAEFDISTPFNFISTNDIIGGNSGSPVINKNAEIVGLAFDGNMESLPGNFIFTTELNRCLSVASDGMMECIKNLYKATRLSDELKQGKIPEKYLIKSEEEKK